MWEIREILSRVSNCCDENVSFIEIFCNVCSIRTYETSHILFQLYKWNEWHILTFQNSNWILNFFIINRHYALVLNIVGELGVSLFHTRSEIRGCEKLSLDGSTQKKIKLSLDYYVRIKTAHYIAIMVFRIFILTQYLAMQTYCYYF